MFTAEMLESIKKVEATRAERIGMEPRRMTAEEKDELLRKFHPDYRQEGFQELKKIIEDILPAHLGIEYDFWFLTWAELEANFPSWQSIQDRDFSWTQLETCVEYL